jgi:hypothetical protein
MIKLFRPPAPYGDVIFCDDIRMEVGNKLTFVGSYLGDMLVTQSFPVIIPKLCLAARIVLEPFQDPIPLILRVWLPGAPQDAPTWEYTIQIDPKTFPAPPQELPEDGLPLRPNLGVNLEHYQIQINTSGYIEVVAEVSGIAFRIGRMYVKAQ